MRPGDRRVQPKVTDRQRSSVRKPLLAVTHPAAMPAVPRLSRPPPPRKKLAIEQAPWLSQPPAAQLKPNDNVVHRNQAPPAARPPFKVHHSFFIDEDEKSLSEDEPRESREEMQRRIQMLTNDITSLENQVSALALHLAVQLSPSTARASLTSRWQRGQAPLRSPAGIKEAEQPTNTFLATMQLNSQLNPMGENFDYTAWIKNLMAVTASDGKSRKQRSISMVFRNLRVYGIGTPTSYQMDMYSSLLSVGNIIRRVTGSGTSRIQILQGCDGMLKRGETLLVLGRPGSGCSTFLKTIAGEMNGIYTDPNSYMNYQGISFEQMRNQLRGEAIYTAEQDVHFPQLTVAQTLSFAAHARVPQNRIEGVSRNEYAEHMKDVVMAILGLTHVAETNVGNDYIRGISGGERKRVSIAEALLNGSPLQSWDNSTRGLDAANAVEFCKNLRIQSDLFARTACVAIYQAPEAAYELFHRVTLLYEGRQIYFGKADDAKKFFMELGFVCRDRQTTSDFLTSLTNPEERIVKSGWEHKVPQTPDDFVLAWKKSSTYRRLVRTTDAYDRHFPLGGKASEKFLEMRKAEQSKNTRTRSPFTISIPMQIRLCMSRGYARLRAEKQFVISVWVFQIILSLIVSSVFFNLQPTTGSLFSRSAVLFYVTLLNAFNSSLEILSVYAQRPIVEKHARYALYHPVAEAVSGIVCDLPSKFMSVTLFNIPLYVMTNLRREPGPFFVFYLYSFMTTMMMSMLFRSIGALSRTEAQAMAPAAVMTLGLCLYTGFPIPVTSMLGWSRWMNYLNPIAYVFEGLMVNELSGRRFSCSSFTPDGPGYTAPGPNSICSTVGAKVGQAAVMGDDYLAETYQYFPTHLWRNFGVMALFFMAFLALYLLATEYITEERSKGEVLLFRRKDMPRLDYRSTSPTGPGSPVPTTPLARRAPMAQIQKPNIQKHRSVIHWRNVCYDITGKNEKRILDHVDGWVKPGTTTALMGASGAGKTTLLDVLASRVRTGVVTGDILVDGVPRDSSFQRKTGYVQQSDLHLSSSTVREALRFSAVLRQPAEIPVSERAAYVEEVIKLLDMELYADAVIGIPGEGLNIEQRKRLTIAIELVAKPQLLVLLDEPTSGLDSQTAWSIMSLLDTLKKHGQAVLCTIHQPSATIFQRFDRLLLLANGRTIYFGEIGENGSTMINYFEENGSPPCPPQVNPAEWMLQLIGAAPGCTAEQDWGDIWRQTENYQQVQMHLEKLAPQLPQQTVVYGNNGDNAFTAPFWLQTKECGYRIFSHYWRTPAYIYSKLALTVISAIYIGFTFFRSSTSQQGVQNQVLSIFMLMTIFSNYISQILPNFVQQRNLFEAREGPAKIFSWQVFMLVNIAVELFWAAIVALLMFSVWYYPTGMYRNAIFTGDATERGGLMALFVWSFMLYATTLAFLLIAAIETAEGAASLCSLLYSMSLTFCGVLASPSVLPRFWIFMYRISPLTYLVSGMVSTAVGNAEVVCSEVELLRIPPPSGLSCEEYLRPFLKATGGYLQVSSTTSNCQVCPISNTDTVIATFGIYFSDRWRNLGLIFVYIVFNIAASLVIYWLSRVPHHRNKKPSKPGDKEKHTEMGDVTFEMYHSSPAQGSHTTLSRSSSMTSTILTDGTSRESMASLLSSNATSTAPMSTNRGVDQFPSMGKAVSSHDMKLSAFSRYASS